MRVLVIATVAASGLFNARPVLAQGGIALENVGATYVFGEQITFLAVIKASIPIQGASIVIFDEGHGIRHVQPLAINADGSTQAVFDVRQNVLRPFTSVRWHYEFTLSDGSLFQSEAYFMRYDDNRFSWQSLESNGLRVFWIQGDAAFAQSALNTALAGLRAINELFPVDLSQPVDIYVYPSQNDLLFLGLEPWTAGHANVSSGVSLVAIEPGLEQSVHMEQRIPHELMHVLLYRHLGAGYNNLPAWLREGMATLVEINPTTEYDRVLSNAGGRNALIPLADLCASFPPQPDSTFLAYAESRSFTSYLRASYGTSKLIDLARAYADGITCDRGVELVYGTSLAQLEFMWKQAMLGQGAWGAALGDMFPYLMLLCVVLGVPLFIGFNAMRRRDGSRSAPTAR
ncbi:MAG TPA: peptidase MA family metallohydrolase [Anaerolineales bacterium]|nr:peptidase MA family metallohydrolase [Anaerolineales bacterium]